MAKKGKKAGSFNLLFTLCACTLALVAFILLLATPSLTWTYKGAITGTSQGSLSGIVGIFGQADPKYNMPWAGLVAFILMTAGLVLMLLLSCLALLKKKIAIAGLLKFIAAGLLIAAGVCVFFEVVAWEAANGSGKIAIGDLANASYSLAAGWIISSILSIVAGAGVIAGEFLAK